jgi:TetR/AcrR family tetracycline transcriptional repressor
MPTRVAPTKPATALELSRHAIVDKALEIADAEALEAVTVRRLAAEFGVTPMALYWHVKNKDELLAAMGDAFYAEVSVGVAGDPAEPPQPWSERLQAIIDQLITAFRRHPASAALAVPRILQCEAGLRLTEITLQLLRDAGFSVQQSADIARTALQTAITLVVGLPGAELALPEQDRARVIEHKRAAVEALSETEFPRLRESVGALTECEDDDAYFRAGTDLFLAGVEALQARLR